MIFTRCSTVLKVMIWASFVCASVGAQVLLHQATGSVGPSGISEFGRNLVGLGDQNGDGVPDYAVSDPVYHSAPAGSGSSAGRVWIYSGVNHQVMSVIDPLPGSSSFAAAISGVGDVNGDGLMDLAVSTSLDVVIFAIPNGQVVQIVSNSNPATHELNPGPAVGDLNQDGLDDFVVCRTARLTAPPTTLDEVILVAGGTGAYLRTFTDPSVSGPGSTFGWQTTSLGDVDGDLIPDLAISRPGIVAGSNAPVHNGVVYVYSGETTSPQPVLLYSIPGPGPNSWVGSSLAALEDVDGDLIADLAILTPLANGYNSTVTFPNPLGGFGAVTIVAGGTGIPIQNRYLSASEFPASIPGQSPLGARISSAGDMNGDGRGDLVLTHYGVSADMVILSGTNLATLRTLSAGAGANFSGALTLVGDLNNNHRSDMIFGSSNSVQIWSLETAGVSYFGTAGPMMGSSPVVGSGGSLLPGATFELNLSNVLGNVDVTLWGGFSTTYWAPFILPLDLGAPNLGLNAVGNSIYISLDSFANTRTFFYGGRAAASLSFQVQSNPAISGFVYNLQWFIFPPFGLSPQRLQTSEAIQIVML